ncbi:MAG: protoheme IX farnesyltransferase [Candidatus Marinimicrobia bacterium]|nr:protoheme IX farnesyltransferase [Candidatus Neomarinimicrobiota bacterium]
MLTVRDYWELTKPRISYLVLTTVFLGYYLGLRAAGVDWGHISTWLTGGHLLLGSLLASGGVSTLNEYLEWDRDSLMRRTAGRPIPSGRISPRAARNFGLVIATAGVLELTLYTHWMTGLITFLTILTYLAIYTPLKRITTWNTLAGAVPGALPPVGGWVAAGGQVGAEALILFAILFCWQIPHFLALALIYRKDYARGGFKMMPLVRSMAYTGAHMIGFSLALIAASLALYAVAGGSMIYVIGSTLLGTTMLAASVVAARRPAVKHARRLLITSVLYLPALLFLILFDRVIA